MQVSGVGLVAAESCLDFRIFRSSEEFQPSAVARSSTWRPSGFHRPDGHLRYVLITERLDTDVP